MQRQNPLQIVASRTCELMEYGDLLNLLTSLDEHGSEADKHRALSHFRYVTSRRLHG